LILVFIGVLAVRSYTKSEKRLLRHWGGKNASSPAIGIRTTYGHSATVKVGGMTCGYCRTRVENAFNSEPALWAQVNLKDEVAFVRSKEPLAEEELRKIVTHAGYEALSVQILN
jgi:copper chaperone CopZ